MLELELAVVVDPELVVELEPELLPLDVLGSEPVPLVPEPLDVPEPLEPEEVGLDPLGVLDPEPLDPEEMGLDPELLDPEPFGAAPPDAPLGCACCCGPGGAALCVIRTTRGNAVRFGAVVVPWGPPAFGTDGVRSARWPATCAEPGDEGEPAAPAPGAAAADPCTDRARGRADGSPAGW